MSGFVADLRFALRQFGQRPGFYLLLAGILALAIGANVAIFTLADAALFRPLPIRDQDQVVRLFVSGTRDDPQFSNGSYPQYEDLARAMPGISDVAAFTEIALHATPGSGAPDRVRGGLATGGFFPLLGMQPALGRFIAPEDDKTFGASPVVVLSDHYWRTHFDASADVIGRTVTINRAPFTVIGVARAGFTGLDLESAVELWLPMSMAGVADPVLGSTEGRIQDRGFSWLDFVARIAPGRSRASFDSELDAFSTRQAQAMAGPERHGAGDWYRAMDVRAAAVDAYGTEGTERNAWLLSGVVALLLALAAANVGGMLAARGEERAHELAVRLGLGATRGRVVRQLLSECALLAAVGIAGGFVIARIVLVQVAREAPQGVILPIDPASALLDARVLAAAIGCALFTVFTAGLVPALRAVRVELAPVLKGTSTSTTRGALRRSWRGALVALQIGLSAMLLVAAGLLLRAFDNTAHVAPGYDPAGALSFSVDLGRHGVPKERMEAEFRRIQERVDALPGVRASAWASSIPVQDGGMRTSIDVAEPNVPQDTHVNLVVASSGYTDVLGLRVLEGQLPAWTGEAQPKVVINRAMAEMFWPGQSPIGRRILNQAKEKGGAEVVAVVSNNKQRSLRERDVPILYLPYGEFRLGNMSLLVRTEGDPATMAPLIERTLRELEPDLPILRMRTLEDRLAASYSQARLFAYLTSVYALLAALLAGAGLYGVLASALVSRTREIGLRVALGATRTRVAQLVLVDTALVIAAGLLLGMAGALVLSRTLDELLFGVGARDPLTFAAVCVAITAVGLAACAWPLRRALAIEPMVALRHE